MATEVQEGIVKAIAAAPFKAARSLVKRAVLGKHGAIKSEIKRLQRKKAKLVLKGHEVALQKRKNRAENGSATKKSSKKSTILKQPKFPVKFHPDDSPLHQPGGPFQHNSRKVDHMSHNIDKVVALLEEVKMRMKKSTPKVQKSFPKMQSTPNQHNAKSAGAAKSALAKLKAKGGSKHKIRTTKSGK